ncbi:MAG: serine--tRNA ligase, partial [Dehalococcoidales bacterium]|nr:serine--tRNA ligase [Dehalococcoidales bacterium]
MLDIKFIRENTDLIREAIAHRRDSTSLEAILEVDAERRKKVGELEELRRDRKDSARKKQTSADEGRDLRGRIRGLEEEVRSLESQLNELLLQVPNVPQATVPVGSSEEDNAVIRSWGEIKSTPFPPKPHWELGESLGIISFEWGVKLSGTRFYVLKGMGARLQRALIAFMLDIHTREHGYQEVYPPFMVKKQCLFGSGNLPKFADNLYHDDEDDLWFVPTAEVPITNLHRDEIIMPGTLPLYYVAYTACFRREKMSAGKDTRGIKRGHQFDKVEMYKLAEPATSNDELEKM